MNAFKVVMQGITTLNRVISAKYLQNIHLQQILTYITNKKVCL